jgi:zinc D-Ala-D-Ala dipeptidase
MNKNLEQHLIDVVEWSKIECIEPIQCHLKYATKENFLGRRVEGYNDKAQNIGLVTREVAEQLCKAQNYFIQSHQASIIIYDSLRPLRAVRDFTEWLNQPPTNAYELTRKQLHYPHIDKNQIAILGYISPHVSGHCYGNVVDISLIKLANNSEFNMGAIFDYFDEIAHAVATERQIGQEAFENRQVLIHGMQQFGFKVYAKEFWHFEYQRREVEEPFDLEITPALRGLNNQR